MAPNKSWMGIENRKDPRYIHGVKESLNEDVDINNDPIVNDDQNFDDDMIGLVNDIYGGSNVNIGTDSNEASIGEEPKGDAAMFYHLLREAKEKLHP
ncbi:hypothetical protein GH714_029320 [Hevea brasiliensis]|uniref:Uncharacterized protein n=1 Tax=Hevea brasiliensis TaxID=3981 RepID=A0A6A6KML0_HEVBR|nr:hypothetical protein GH714_029320 [Hevea brasiliensis]